MSPREEFKVFAITVFVAAAICELIYLIHLYPKTIGTIFLILIVFCILWKFVRDIYKEI